MVTMALMMFAIAILLFVCGYIIGPILQELGITLIARIAVALFFTAMGTYMFWIGVLFARDQLHDVNYGFPLVAVRAAVFASLIGLAVQAFRNRRGR